MPSSCGAAMALPCIEDLPDELLLRIFSLIPALHLLKAVAPSCTRFQCLVADKLHWQRRQKECQIKISEKEEESPDHDIRRIIASCERDAERFKKLPRQNPYVLNAHYGTVNGLRLYEGSSGERRCISGGRDRLLCIWDIDSLVYTENPSYVEVDDDDEAPPSVIDYNYLASVSDEHCLHRINDAHNAWIWRVTVPNATERLFSCGWDCAVKNWELTPTGEVRLAEHSMTSAVLGLARVEKEGEVVAISTFVREVVLLDFRLENEQRRVARHSKHTGPVIGVHVQDNLLYSWSEDSTILVADIRNLKHGIEGPEMSPSAKMKLNEYAYDLHIGHGVVTAGTGGGNVALMKPATLKSYGSYNVEKRRGRPPAVQRPEADPCRAAFNTGGAVLTLSKKGLMDAFSYGIDPRPLMRCVDLGGEPARLDYLKGDIAVALGDGRILLWPVPERLPI